jgi:hypothetical protein
MLPWQPAPAAACLQQPALRVLQLLLQLLAPFNPVLLVLLLH